MDTRVGFDSYSSDGSELSTSDDSDVRQDSSDDTELEESSSDDDLDVSLDSSSGEDTPYSSQQHTSASPTTDPLDQPLYDGAQMTVWDTYLLLMQHSLRHNLTKRAFSDLLKVVGTLLPRESFTSYYRLRKFFMNEYEDLTLSRHFCCRACHTTIDNAQSLCPNGCEGSTSIEFLAVSVEAQLKRKLQDNTFWKSLHMRFERETSPNHVCDVYDGMGYKKHDDFVRQPGNVSLVVNTDGVKMFNSSSISMWPIWLVVNELPPSERFKRKNVVLAGLWFHRDKPTMTTFLRPLVKEMNVLANKGVEVTTPDGKQTCKACLLFCSADLPARAVVLNMRQYNGRHGCSQCEDEGQPRARSHLQRNWPYQTTSSLRTHSSIMDNVRDCVENNEPVMGIKGASVLCVHKPFDLGTGVVIDAMHCVFLGVVGKQLLPYWFGVVHRSKPCSIRKRLKECTERLVKIQVPHDFSRAVKGLDQLKLWKASDYRSWVLYFSLPVLHGILHDPYYSHYALLVAAMHILFGESISERSLSRANRYLQRFCQMFASLYGEDACSMNVHSLKHLTRCVQNWGPLWAYSCFPFESFNGQIKRRFHGTRCMNHQLAFSFLLCQLLPQKVEDNNSWIKLPDCIAIGRLYTAVVDDRVMRLVRSFEPMCSSNTASRFLRARVGKTVYHSQMYTRTKTRNSYTVCYKSEDGIERFGLVQYYLSLTNTTVAVVTPLTPAHCHNFPSQLRELDDCIVSVNKELSIGVIPVRSFLYKCIYIDSCDVSYVAKPPYLELHDD